MPNKDRSYLESDYSSDGSVTLHDRPPTQSKGTEKSRPDRRLYESSSSEESDSDESDTFSHAILQATDYVADAVLQSITGSEKSAYSEDNTEDDERLLRNEMGDSESESDQSSEQSETESESGDETPLKFVYHEERATTLSMASGSTTASGRGYSEGTSRNGSVSNVSTYSMSSLPPPPPPPPHRGTRDDASASTATSSLPSEMQPMVPPMLLTPAPPLGLVAESLENPDDESPETEVQQKTKQPFFSRFRKKNKKKEPAMSEVSDDEEADDAKNMGSNDGQVESKTISRDVNNVSTGSSSNMGNRNSESSTTANIQTATDSHNDVKSSVLIAPVPLKDRDPSVPLESVENIECVVQPTDQSKSRRRSMSSLAGPITAGLMMGSVFSRKKSKESDTTEQSSDLEGATIAPAPSMDDVEMSMESSDKVSSNSAQAVPYSAFAAGSVAAAGVAAVAMANTTNTAPEPSPKRLTPKKIDNLPSEEVPGKAVKNGTLLVIRSKLFGGLSKKKESAKMDNQLSDKVDVESNGEKLEVLPPGISPLNVSTASTDSEPSEDPPTPERGNSSKAGFISRDISVADTSFSRSTSSESENRKRKEAALLGFDGSEPPEESRRFIMILVIVCIAAFIATFFGVWAGLRGGAKTTVASETNSRGNGVGAGMNTSSPSMSPWVSPNAPSPTSLASPNNPEPDSTSNDVGSVPATVSPTRFPTVSPTIAPAVDATASPTVNPSAPPTASATATPTISPTALPTSSPSQGPTATPTASPTATPTVTPTASPTDPVVTFRPGKLEVLENGLLLSAGLSARIIARTGESVTGSSDSFHAFPDGAACFVHPDGIENGWAYVSNCDDDDGRGGVGAIYFDGQGQVTGYDRLLDGTNYNSGGGPSPWGTWITAEESLDGEGFWDVEPYGLREPLLTALGNNVPLYYDSFTFDARNENDPKFFFSEDSRSGPVRRFTPDPDLVVPLTDPNAYEMIQTGYDHEYLVLEPNSESGRSGNFRWSQSREEGETSTSTYHQNVEGVTCVDGVLILSTKRSRELIFLDLDSLTYFVNNPVRDQFQGEPDSVTSLYKTGENANGNNILFITEEADAADGFFSGVHGLEEATGNYFPILKATGYSEQDEIAGVALSPDKAHMYVAIQDQGVILDVFRADGLGFDAPFDGVDYAA